jgi:hypothetical protein
LDKWEVIGLISRSHGFDSHIRKKIMTTTELQAQEADIKAQIKTKMMEIAGDDVTVMDLLAKLTSIQDQLVLSMVRDQQGAGTVGTDTNTDTTNRKTDASLGTSAR